MLAWSMGQLLNKLGQQVLFPAYAQILQNRPDELPQKMLRARLYLAALSLPAFGLLILFGPQIIGLLYDDRYQQAGIYLAILAAGGAFAANMQPYGSALLACGDSKWHTAVQTANALTRIGAVFLGYQLGNVTGMLIAVVLTQVLVYPLRAVFVHRHGLWQPWLDAAVLLIIGAICANRYLLFAVN
jgi:O-antigen/teichoic acid export membrane protein